VPSLQVAAFLGAIVLLPLGAILIALGVRQPRSVAADPAAIGGPVPHPISRVVPANHRSTSAERQECRLRLGPSYDAQLVAVADNLAQRPAALRAITMESGDLPIDDLVTVSTYLHGPPTGLDRALRKGAAESHRAVIACLASGLRRFPFHHGACYGVARRVGVPLDVYQPGRTIVEPAFIRTDTRWSPGRFSDGSASDTEIVFAFWSRTGREVGALAADSTTVLFTAGTSFRVLGVRPPAADHGPAVVFLAECPSGSSPSQLLARAGLGRRRILAQLRRPLTAGVAAGAGTESAGSELSPLAELAFTPGFDATGRPYREEPHQP
jgi:hypothetical protein